MKININIFLLIFMILILMYLNFFFKKIEKFYDKSDIILGIHTVFILKENIPFLEEWIVYHKKIGFDKFYLYDNTGSKGRNGSTKNVNKRKINFDNLVTLTDKQLNIELNNILDRHPEIKYIKWQPRNDKNEIIYGYDRSVEDYNNNYSNECSYTTFIDIDEFIYVNSNISLKKYIESKNVDKLIIQQTKMIDRYCGAVINDTVMDMTDSLVIDKQWGPKNIIKNKVISLRGDFNMHDIPISSKNIYNCPKTELFFFHYNISNWSYKWMKNYLKKDNFKKKKGLNLKILVKLII